MAKSLEDIGRVFSAEYPRVRTKRGANIAFFSSLAIVLVCAILFAAKPDGHQSFGGFGFYKIATTSMQREYNEGSLIITREVDPLTLVVGDDIAFISGVDEVMAQRIDEIKEGYEGTGMIAFATIGIDDELARITTATSDKVLGKVIIGVPFLGNVLNWLDLNIWLVGAILLVVFALVKRSNAKVAVVVMGLLMASMITNQEVRAEEIIAVINQGPDIDEKLSEEKYRLITSGKVTPLNMRRVFLEIFVVLGGTKIIRVYAKKGS